MLVVVVKFKLISLLDFVFALISLLVV